MWVVGCCLSGVFCFGLMPLLLCFRGDAVRFSFFLGAFFLASYVFFLVGFALLVIKSYLSKKKNPFELLLELAETPSTERQDQAPPKT